MNKMQLYGEVLALMSHSIVHRDDKVSDFEVFVKPAIETAQYIIFRDKDRLPVGYCSWALLSEAVVHGIDENTMNLRPEHWQSGSQVWFVDFIAPFGGVFHMVRHLKALMPKETIKCTRVYGGRKTKRIGEFHNV